MKTTILLTICMALAAAPVANAAAVKTADANEHIALAIVFDTSSTSSSTWTQLHILARQSFSSLQNGDRLILISATTGKPVVKANFLIESPTSQNQQLLNSKLAAINQAFLARSDLANALAIAFDLLQNQPYTSKCCLILTDGRHGNSQIEQIRRLAAAFKKMGWSLCVTASDDANRVLFLAGSQREFQVVTLNNANLPQWLETVRPHAIPKPPEGKPPLTEQPKAEPSKIISVPDTTPSKPKQAQVSDANDKAKTALPKPPEIKKTADTNVSLPITKPPVITEKPSLIIDTRSQIPSQPLVTTKPSAVTEKPPLMKEVQPKIPVQTKPPTQPKSAVRKFKIWQIGVIFMVIALILLILIATAFGRRSVETSTNIDSPSGDSNSYHLIAIWNDQRYDLGDTQTIRTLIIGKNPASPIPLFEDGIEDQHLKISPNRQDFKIRNLATESMFVNGTVLTKGQKEKLLLPATIQLTKNVRFSLFLEQTKAQEQSDSAEKEGEVS